MLRRQQEIYVEILQIIDAGLLSISLFLAHSLRFWVISDWFDLGPVGPFNKYVWMVVLLLPLGPFVLERQGFYRLQMMHNLWAGVWVVIKSTMILLGMLVAFIVAFHIEQGSISRAALFLFIPVASLLLIARQAIFRLWLVRRGARTIQRRHLMICGRPEDRQRWREEVAQTPGRSFVICAELDLANVPLPEFIRHLHEESIDVVVFSIDHTLVTEVSPALLACEAEGVEAWVSADLFHTSLARPQFDFFAGRPLLVFRSTPEASFQLLFKRVLDVVVALLMLLILTPLVILPTIVAIFLTSGRPVFFTQRRSGLYGRPFTMFKFRSMKTDAEQARAELVARNEMSGPVFKIDKDPRVTAVGRWIRKFSIDELPQLWNVLRGEMSLVGPRPLPLYETQNFSNPAQRRRMSVRPGLTCLWQISGRSAITDFGDWVKLDLEYIDNWSLLLDLEILMRTVPVVIFGKGAK